MQGLMAVLLAGGKGTRLKQLTRNIPKPLVPYGGSCRMLDYSLQNCQQSGVRQVLLMSQHLESQLHQYLLQQWQPRLDIHFGCYNAIHQQPLQQVYQQVKRVEEKGTADALIQNQAYIQQPWVNDVLVLHSDHVYNFDYRPMYQYHKQTGAALTIGFQAIPRRFVSLFGMVQFDQQHNLLDFVEKPAEPVVDTVFTAVCIFNQEILFAYLQQLSKGQWQHDISRDVIPAMLANNEKIKGFQFMDYWEDIGTTERYYLGHMKLVDKAIQLNSPQTLPVSGQLTEQQLAECDISQSIIYPGAELQPGCRIYRSVVLPDTLVQSHEVLEGALAGGPEREYFQREQVLCAV